ncbi:LacI family DNA-binding transcriptional regulator [Edaphobacter dinghuensis]|uniref:LacI family DNA-binding transcriptional regulator n=1 Tax=Edaphobacter dinghuensis TaxID=1560005 RepID=UPI00166D549C|nr:LacI family DNA-binding transcriptional regulator [Edaphobacter dinghuensis]
MPTIVEVAKHARVSIATVSNVIRGTRRVSPALQDRVQKAIRELDYSPNEIARSLKVKQTRMLALVLPDITNPFFPEIIRGAEDTAFDRGYFLMTANTDEQIGRERRIMSALRSYRVDGILLASAPGKDSGHIRSIMQGGISVVCLDRTVAGINTDAVLLDNVRGGRECVRHLIQGGHSKIAIITGSLSLQTGLERLRGYEEALRESDIEVDRNLVLEGDFRYESGYRLGKELLKRRVKPTAVFVCNGVMTVGVLKAFEELGVRCPEDISLATFDDLAVDRSFHPHLTAVVQPGYEMGARAATILMDRVEGKLTNEPFVVRIVPTLVVRESTRARKPRSSLRESNSIR